MTDKVVAAKAVGNAAGWVIVVALMWGLWELTLLGLAAAFDVAPGFGDGFRTAALIATALCVLRLVRRIDSQNADAAADADIAREVGKLSVLVESMKEGAR